MLLRMHRLCLALLTRNMMCRGLFGLGCGSLPLIIFRACGISYLSPSFMIRVCEGGSLCTISQTRRCTS